MATASNAYGNPEHSLLFFSHINSEIDGISDSSSDSDCEEWSVLKNIMIPNNLYIYINRFADAVDISASLPNQSTGTSS